ncbi:MAG: aminodeoxychorismate/anthranilate synthase component II [Candidatus Omnitrophica bacterium]|nr:aminodeoxychorismate/anthranilate synthase component II [Candidatus Omnitrophota bacterium]
MILVIDNYDSFTYNLVQYLGELNQSVVVYRNDKIDIDAIERLNPDYIVVSPGPGDPKTAGISNDAIRYFKGKIPILGVCLGHQCVAYCFGGKIIAAKKLMHGKTSFIYHNKKTIFKNIKNPFEATRYHSLVVDKKSMPKGLEIIASTKDTEIMAIKHRQYPIWGVQFHPESILTKDGKRILKNFLEQNT